MYTYMYGDVLLKKPGRDPSDMRIKALQPWMQMVKAADHHQRIHGSAVMKVRSPNRRGEPVRCQFQTRVRKGLLLSCRFAAAASAGG